MYNKPTIIVAGEPNSVFLEIFFKSIKIFYKRPLILIASKKLLLSQMKKLKFNYKIKLINRNRIEFKKLSLKKINLIDVDYKFKKPFEVISDKSNDYISKCFLVALKILKDNQCSGLINGPISKKDFLKTKFLGITEYLSYKSLTKKDVVMLIYNKQLSVSPLTTHLPIKDVNKKISIKKILNHVDLINKFYKKKFKKTPKIAITGLNPHCESNYKSSEEKKYIIPAIKILHKKKYKIKGPFPADTIFMKDKIKNFDVVIGMYHDQVLTPAKTLYGFNSINITLGLPFIRVSPDHGPNIEMLGKNTSSPESLIQSIKFLDN
tara:strand:- start:1659 stop:2621 length:963 start_codon:yes stop_codon:yes gene_type:complete